MQTDITTVVYDIHDLTEYINWIYFFHAWGFQPRFAAIADIHGCDACRASWLASFPVEDRAKAAGAMQLHKEANRMLNSVDGKYKVYAIYRLMNANSDGDNLLLEGTRFPLLRQQTRVRPDDPFLCLSDFVRPLSSGIPDTVGAFATTIDENMEQPFEGDDYKLMLVKTLGERLAEAAAEKVHETIRKSVWGYAKDEHLTMKQLLNEDYQGIRPAVGYPSLPDISVSFLLDELLDMKRIGIKLTENGMMQPHASVCGLMFAHPASRYFSVGKIDEEQLADYAARRGCEVSEIRKYLDGQGFMEVETPMLVANAGGAAARPFETHYNALNEDVKLRISLELYLKRLIVGGLERVYEIGRVFRNEGVDTRHNPEFTLMELYQAYTDYEGMMELTESMFRYLAEKVCGSAKISYNGIEIDLSKPFERLTMNDAIKKYAGIDFDEVADDEAAKKLADEHHIEYEERHKKGDIINLFFEEYCEKELIQPTFIMDHPIEISPLTKKKPSDPNKVERFELFINTWEMCNAYSELNDPIDQRERFKAQDALADAGDEEANHTDEDFLNALEIGMPPTGGIGYGIDRLVMLLTDSQAIRDVLLFPTMKSIGGVKAENGVSSKPSEEVKAEPEKIDFSNVKIEPLFEEEVDFDTFSKSDFRAVKVKECVAVPKSKKLLQFTLDDGTGTDRTILSGIHAYYEPEELVGKTLIAITNLPPRKMMGIESCGMLLSAVNNLKDSEDEELHLLMVDNHIPAGAKLY